MGSRISAHYAITYSTEYRYESDVTDQHNAIRVRPLNDATQRLEGFDLSVDPPARLYRYTDYFGTEVVQFANSEPHDHLAVRAESRVRVEQPPPPPDPPWEALATTDYAEAGAEYLGPLDPPANPERIGVLLEQARSATPLAMVEKICTLIPDRFEYRAGVTYVGSTVNDLLAGGAGVCQDFVHLALTMLRREGVASRYVSGYSVRRRRRRRRVGRGQHPCLARGAAARARRRAPLGRRRPHQPDPRRRRLRQDRPRPRLLRRAADPRRLPRRRDVLVRGKGADEPDRRRLTAATPSCGAAPPR